MTLLLGQCFRKQGEKERMSLIHYHTNPTFDDPEKESLENIVGKGENAGNQHFLLFPQCFLLVTKQISNPQSLLFCRLQIRYIQFGQA